MTFLGGGRLNKLDRSYKEFFETVSFDAESFFSSVLLIEDELAHAALIKRALRGVVGEVTHASSAEEGLDLLKSEYVDLVFCDLHLPDASGLEIIGKIRTVRSGLPIIVLTSSSCLDDAVSAMREGAWDYMVKDFTEDFAPRLTLTVERTLERCFQQLREIQVRQERDAFWVAASAAQDGLAVLTDEGSVIFENEAFRNFMQLSAGRGVSGNVVDVVASVDFKVGSSLYAALCDEASDLLWESEFNFAMLGEREEGKHCFELRLSSVSSKSASSESFLVLPRLRYKVLWVRDITRQKEHESFQRDLLSTTTHDLKGPLSAILTSAELLVDYHCKNDEKAVGLLTRIGSCARNAISIIDELLSARRIQDGVVVVKPRWQDVNEILEDLILDYQPVAKAKDLDFTFVPAGDGLEIYADKIGLSRALGNLVSNALKFTDKRGKVVLSAERIGGEVKISVSDSGPGIDEKVRHKLFQRFGRLERDREVEGTGIGLFVTKNIVESHGGRIELTSTLNVGTTFVLVFPDGPRSTVQGV